MHQSGKKKPTSTQTTNLFINSTWLYSRFFRGRYDQLSQTLDFFLLLVAKQFLFLQHLQHHFFVLFYSLLLIQDILVWGRKFESLNRGWYTYLHVAFALHLPKSFLKGRDFFFTALQHCLFVHDLINFRFVLDLFCSICELQSTQLIEAREIVNAIWRIFSSILTDSSLKTEAGVMAQMIAVRELPPSAGWRIRVSLLSRYGM